MGIVASKAGMFAKKTGASYADLVIYNDQKKHFESSWGKSFAEVSNRQRRLTEGQELNVKEK